MWKNLFSIKYGALAVLVLQNTFLVIFMGISRTSKGEMYASSTAVVTMEIVKFASCLSFLVLAENKSLSMIYSELISNPMEIFYTAIPSVLYSVQNNLLYFALSHLDPTTYQVGYQLKILTTAVCSVFMLNKKLSLVQWFSLIVLTIGVCLAQSSSHQNAKAGQNTTSGFVAVILAACTSGFAGVTFEKLLKNSGTSLWMRNVQMGLSSILFAYAGIFTSGDWPAVRDNGFFHGYNKTVWSVIALQAIGGLVVAVVVKYADNILKGFAAAFSILTSCVLCYFLLDFHPNFAFLGGTLLVVVSGYLYQHQPQKAKSNDEVTRDREGTARSRGIINSRDEEEMALLARAELNGGSGHNDAAIENV